MVIIEGVHPLAILEIVFGIPVLLLGIFSTAGLVVFAIGGSFDPIGFLVLGFVTLSLAGIGVFLIRQGVRLRNQTGWTGTRLV